MENNCAMENVVALNVIEPIAAHQELYECVIVISPGEEDGELKGQDRASTFEVVTDNAKKKQMAIVCDGLSQSPNSAEAAEYVSSNLHRLYEEDGIGQIVDGLREKRATFGTMPILLDDKDSPVLRGIFEEIVKEKRSRSHQTTFIAASLETNRQSVPTQFEVRILGCGDSGVFIFTTDGKLRYNNLGLLDERDPLAHVSAITEALPDSFDERGGHLLSHSLTYREDLQILLCSDGLYDSFATFAELFYWLSENAPGLRQNNNEEVMRELHSCLSNRKGDDDISFVWLFPREESFGLTESKPGGTSADLTEVRTGEASNLSTRSVLWQSTKRMFRNMNFIRGSKTVL